MKKSFWIVFAAMIAAFIAVNISVKNQEKKNTSVEQNLEPAKITVTAPLMKRQESLEQKAKNALKDKLKTAYFFSSSYKKSEYTVHYCEYKNEVNFQTAVDSIVSKFKDNNLEYEVKDNPAGGCDGALLEGFFEKDGKKFGIKNLLVKNKTSFWQAMTIYPYSDKNDKAAESFIKSAVINCDA